jgi:predicted MFS family arabinose efflux permease
MPDTQQPGQRSPVRAVSLAAAATTVGVLPTFMVGALSVQIRDELVFSNAQVGALFATFSVATALLSPRAGRLAERVGAGRSLGSAVSLSGAAMLGIATLGRSWTALLVFAVVGGVGNAMIQPCTNLVVARSVRGQRQGIAFGIKQSAIPAATMLAGVSVPIAGLWLGWRWAFVAAGLACVPLAVGCARLGTLTGPRRGARRTTLDWRRLLLLAAAAGVGTAAGNSIGAFLVPTGVAVGLGPGTAGLTLAVASTTAIATRVSAGWAADRGAVPAYPAIVALLLAGAAGLGLIGIGAGGLFVLGAMIGMLGGMGWNGLMNYAVVRDYPTTPAASTAVTQGGLALGAGLGPLTFGLLVDLSSFAVAWTAAAGCMALATVFVLAATRLEPRR